MENPAKISIVTATFNAAVHLPRLIESLRQQTMSNFEWVVADGASTDGTLELLDSITDLNIIVSSQPDFGIYDALNRAIKLASGDYYIVAGADDVFDEEAISNFLSVIGLSGADIIAADAMYGKRCMSVKEGPPWLFGQFSHIAAHSLATAFRKEMHLRFGYYTRLYPIAADQFFVMTACANGATVCKGRFVAGNIGQSGLSSVDRVGSATEVFRVQVVLGRSIFIQLILFIFRLLRSG